MVSAICLISDSLMLQPKVFQLFQPMGGVRATPLSRALACSSRAIKPPIRTPAASRAPSLRKRTSMKVNDETSAETNGPPHQGGRMEPFEEPLEEDRDGQCRDGVYRWVPMDDGQTLLTPLPVF